MSVVSVVKTQVESLGRPSKVAVVLSLVAGGLQAANTALFGSNQALYGGVTALLVAAAAVGISPLLGAQFRTALHLSVRLGYALTAAVTILTVALAALPLPEVVHDVVSGVLTTAAGLGFAPVTLPSVFGHTLDAVAFGASAEVGVIHPALASAQVETKS